jgi:AcrR family transcriptional regulator
MPRNYRHIDRGERVERLVAIASEQFLSLGYTGTTMAQIARLAGLTNAAVYWYFPSKDDALAAVHRRMLAATRERLRAEHDLTPMTRLERYLEIIRAEARPLHRMLHERAPYSLAVADALDEIHRELEDMIRAAVRARSARFADLERIMALSMAVIEGTSAVNAEAHSSELVRWAIDSLVPIGGGNTVSASERPGTKPPRAATGRGSAR